MHMSNMKDRQGAAWCFALYVTMGVLLVVYSLRCPDPDKMADEEAKSNQATFKWVAFSVGIVLLLGALGCMGVMFKAGGKMKLKL